ncbi:MAG: 2,3-bisphosphoglycerate-independent phosphoglycerate mutase [Crocinitomicaceae bacterium]|nr:2,3-bisphosphoglycerate-independent phosphoglycerate mutase [Crocinitomicaceae bacterium]
MNKVGLIILDGWGIGDGSKADAIAQSKTPFMDSLFLSYPHSQLIAGGEDVGLPDGQMGNSEVGHLNIGAGRIVYQELTRINKSILEGDFFLNPILLTAFEEVKSRNCKLHFIGLVSNGGVHSSEKHLHALCAFAHQQGVKTSYIHAFTDGRDCDPTSGHGFITETASICAPYGAKIASVIGRYFAMDRDNRWERIKKAYDLLVNGVGIASESASDSIKEQYLSGITDEFLEPILLDKNGLIETGDVVISFNFRTDRPREITKVLTQESFPTFDMSPLSLYYCTMTNYDDAFENIPVIFQKENLVNTLGQIISEAGLSQVRIAETEKYPHVTYFFNGGREEAFKKEIRIMVASPKVATYDLQPEMSALIVRDKLIDHINNETPDFICLNFANPDMVGHTGVFSAIVKAVETIDNCLQKVVEVGLQYGYEFLIIADHGNADMAINPDGSPNTAHSLNPVPVILITKEKGIVLRKGRLADVAPTILGRLGIEKSKEMTGKDLVL